MRHIPTPTPPDDDEIAAALAAVRCYVEQAQLDPAAEPPRPVAWHHAGMLEAMGQPASYGAAPSTPSAWSSVERAARAHRWSYGIVGL